MESLGSVKAVVPPFIVPNGKDAERANFAWLETHLPALTGVMEWGCKFPTMFCVVAGFNLLERLGCQHVRALADLSTAIGADSRNGASEAIRTTGQVGRSGRPLSGSCKTIGLCTGAKPHTKTLLPA